MLLVRIMNQLSLLSPEMLCLSIFQSYILALRVYLSRVSCILLNPTTLLRECILVESLVYFLSLHPCFVSIFQLSLLTIFQAYIIASQVYFSRFSCLFFKPTPSLWECTLVKCIVYFSSLHSGFVSLFQSSWNKPYPDRQTCGQTVRYTVTIVLISNSRWSNKNKGNRVSSYRPPAH